MIADCRLAIADFEIAYMLIVIGIVDSGWRSERRNRQSSIVNQEICIRKSAVANGLICRS
jgi:hypothetical protein